MVLRLTDQLIIIANYQLEIFIDIVASNKCDLRILDSKYRSWIFDSFYTNVIFGGWPDQKYSLMNTFMATSLNIPTFLISVALRH